ncbi:hypothetical protein [Microbacterium sp. SMR1]|uniref:hypothetical protein n=1 Tax=Microbacterium sp. SMR1 TaxID=1497340 RepID=UPI0011BE1447|nr:hypothetical protein [Microbacterium sp. SMR1]
MARVTEETPQELAQHATDWDRVSWWKLEATAFRAHPEVQLALARLAPREAWSSLVPDRPAFVQPLLAFAQIASLVIPAVAAFASLRAVLIEGDQLDLAVAGTAMGVAALIALFGVLSQRGRPESVHPRTMRTIGIGHLISALAVAVVAVQALLDDRLLGAWGIAGVLVDLALGAFLTIRHRRMPTDENRDNIERAGAGLNRRIDALPPAAAAATLTTIGEAVDILASRGLISATDAARARRAPLGLLAATMTDAPAGRQ